VTIRDNEFSFCPVGVYVISRGLEYGGDYYLTRNFLLEGNYFHDNGLVDDYNVHQAYIQGVNFVVQYNYFGNPIRYDIDGNGTIDNDEASNGNDLKMRTVGELVRYNYFENGAHSIDLIDIEDFRYSVFPWFFALLEDRTAGGGHGGRPRADAARLGEVRPRQLHVRQHLPAATRRCTCRRWAPRWCTSARTTARWTGAAASCGSTSTPS
jgi:hypothetical protein